MPVVVEGYVARESIRIESLGIMIVINVKVGRVVTAGE